MIMSKATFGLVFWYSFRTAFRACASTDPAAMEMVPEYPAEVDATLPSLAPDAKTGYRILKIRIRTITLFLIFITSLLFFSIH